MSSTSILRRIMAVFKTEDCRSKIVYDEHDKDKLKNINFYFSLNEFDRLLDMRHNRLRSPVTIL